jgi:AcrR family transcriptional regulator
MSVREENKKLSRARILKAARHTFRERGYEESMMSDIADRSEISRQTLYNYFPTKDSLLLGIADEELLLLEQVIRDLPGKAGEPARATDKIRLLIETYTMDSFEYLALARRIAFNMASKDSHMRLHRLLERLVRDAKAAGEINTEVSTAAATSLLFGCYYAIIFEATSIADLTKTTCRKRIRTLLTTALNALA